MNQEQRFLVHWNSLQPFKVRKFRSEIVAPSIEAVPNAVMERAKRFGYAPQFVQLISCESLPYAWSGKLIATKQTC